MIDIYKWGKEHEVKPGVLAIKASAMPDLKNSSKWLESLKINTLVEIGTCYGLSAAHFALHVNKVHTFDVCSFEGRDKLWEDTGVADKICFHLIKTRNNIRRILKDMDFDFAFIDARHEVEEVRKDFRVVKRCKRVLFHDVDSERFPDNYEFLNEIGGRIVYNNIGYWEG